METDLRFRILACQVTRVLLCSSEDSLKPIEEAYDEEYWQATEPSGVLD